MTAPAKTGDILFSLVIPTYNERENIARLIAQLVEGLERCVPGDYELIVVDDDSPDLTWKLVQQLTAEYSQLQIVRRQRSRGLASAVVCGWQVARGQILGVMDADFQHPPAALLPLLARAIAGVDLVVASRYAVGGEAHQWSRVRQCLSWGAQRVGVWLCPRVVGQVSDPMSGYFVVRREAISGVRLNPVGYKILLEVIGRGRIKRIAEVGYVFGVRSQGQSKVSWGHPAAYLLHLLRLRFGGWRWQRRV